MWRALLHVMLCVVLGAITSVAVAWVAAITKWNREAQATERVGWPSSQEGQIVTLCERRPLFAVRLLYINVDPGVARAESVELRGRGLDGGERYKLRRVSASHRACHVPEGVCNSRTEFQFGWPLACTWGAADSRSMGCEGELLPLCHVMRVWPRSGTVDRTRFLPEEMSPFTPFADTRVANVPTGVLWPGLGADTGVFAGAWWMILLLPGQLRRTIRRRAGRCLACGYDLRGLARGGPCPECGNRAAGPASNAPVTP